MKFTISREAFKKHKIEPDVGFYLIAQYFGAQPTDATLRKASAADYLSYGGFDNSAITRDGVSKVEEILLDGEFKGEGQDGGDRWDALAERLREIYPKGHKPGTNYMWRDSKPVIANKLRALVKNFGCGFSDDEAADATRRYVESFKTEDDRYMQLLKYFILKKNENGELNSQLLSYIENKDAGEPVADDWTSSLR